MEAPHRVAPLSELLVTLGVTMASHESPSCQCYGVRNRQVEDVSLRR
jgi:hypothetical protein